MYTYVNIQIHMYSYTHTYIYTHTHIYTYKCIANRRKVQDQKTSAITIKINNDNQHSSELSDMKCHHNICIYIYKYT
jgi:hypothetical protein